MIHIFGVPCQRSAALLCARSHTLSKHTKRLTKHAFKPRAQECKANAANGEKIDKSYQCLKQVLERICDYFVLAT